MNSIKPRGRGMKTLGWLAWTVSLLSLGTGSVAGQRAINWPLRIQADADAVVGGPIAVFWNPANVEVGGKHGELTVLNVNSPEISSVGGLGAAGAWQLDARTLVAVGYHHFGVKDIERTTTSPDAGDGPAINVSEDLFAAAATRRLGRVAVGAVAEYTKPSADLGGSGTVRLGAGVSVHPDLPLQPVLAFAGRAEDAGVEWVGGVAVTWTLPAAPDWSLQGSYGVAGDPAPGGVAHRLAVGPNWRDLFRLAVGLEGDPEAGGTAWSPSGDARVQINRYIVSVLREQLPNGFGATYTFRLSVSF